VIANEDIEAGKAVDAIMLCCKAMNLGGRDEMKAKGKYKQLARYASRHHAAASLTMASLLLLSSCSLFGENKPTEAKITSPAPNSTINVGEQVQIEGLVTGDGITKVDIVIDNTTYASLSAPDQSAGVPNFPIGGSESPVPWTPLAAGPHALQLIVYGAPDNALKAKSEPVLITAQAAESVALPTEAPQPTAALELQPTLAAPGVAGATAAPGSTAAPGTTAGAPSATVINDFVNVRKGPGVGYDKVGQLNKGETAPVKGKSSDGGWLQISFPAAAGGVGWVKLKDDTDTLVQGNDAANNVPVVAAPALPAAPVVANNPARAAPANPAPSGNVQIIPIGPVVTAAPPAVAAPPAASGPLLGSRNILKVNVNPVSSGGTLYATWSIPNFRDGEFDRGDGSGFKGPIAGSMTVDVPGITGARTLVLRWRDTGGQQLEDTIVVQGGISGSGSVVAPPPQTGSLTGSRSVLRINTNPVNSGSTVYATWSIPNFKEGEFDKGDGAGFKGPIAGSMTVDIPNVTSSRNITLRWRDTGGQQLEDTLVLQVAGSAAVVATSANRGTCSSSDPNWRGGTAAYTFCAARDMNWTDGGKEIRSFTEGQDFTLTANWDVYGIAGIWFIVEPSGQVCGPAGTSVINRQTVGTGSESFNIKDLKYGGYKAHLRVKRNDGAEVDYNEKFLCVGNSSVTGPTATPGSAAPTATPNVGVPTAIPDAGGGGGVPTALPIDPSPQPGVDPTPLP